MPAHRHSLSMARRAFAALIGLVLLSLPAAAFDFGTVTGGKINPLPIAINGFLPGQGADSQAQMITEVISNDLQHSGFFNPLPPDSFLERIQSFDQTPNFQSWRQIQAQAMVVGQAYMDGGKIHVEFKLYDTASQQQLLGQQFTASPGIARRIAHRVADAIFQKLTGIDGYFDTRVVYVDESGPKDHRVKRIAIMDQDGYNPHPLTDGRDLVLTPRFSPNSQEIAYMSFGNNNPRVYIMNIDTKQREIVGEFPNMSFSPRFSPDGQKVIMSLQDGGNSNIFELDLRSRQVRQITNADSINTAPCYSPDGSQIVFESDRGGTQQIYLMGADGSGQNRISFGDGRYSTPVWSPDGKWIAFTKQASGKFAIGVMKPDGSGERILTEGFHNEGPTWAPNSHVVMFFRDSQGEKGGPQLFSVDVTGYNEQQIPTSEFASDPAWSPRLN